MNASRGANGYLSDNEAETTEQILRERNRLRDRVADLETGVDAYAASEREAEAAIARVRTLHQPMQHGGLTICAHCSGWTGSRCRGEINPHPCPTIAAVDGP